MTDSNGYNEILFDTEQGKCFNCGREVETCRHEIWHGANRQLSKYYGLWINVCVSCR